MDHVHFIIVGLPHLSPIIYKEGRRESSHSSHPSQICNINVRTRVNLSLSSLHVTHCSFHSCLVCYRYCVDASKVLRLEFSLIRQGKLEFGRNPIGAKGGICSCGSCKKRQVFCYIGNPNIT